MKTGLLCAALALAAALAPASALCRAQEPDYGYSLEFSPSRPCRPNILLNEGRPFRTRGKQLELSFSFRNHRTMQFGYFLKIAGDGAEDLDLLYYVNDNSQFCMAATLADEVVEFPPVVTSGIWERLSVLIDPRKGLASITCGNLTRCLHYSKSAPDRFRIVFGDPTAIGAGQVVLADLDIRDISLDAGGRKFNWSLREHGEGFSLDSARNVVAKAAGGEWIVERHCNWTPVWHCDASSLDGVAFDGSLFRIFADNRLLEVGMDGKVVSSTKVRGGFPAIGGQYQIITLDGRPVSFLPDEGSVSTFDIKAGKWSLEKPFSGDYLHLGNTSCVDPGSGSICSFGGYGLYHFSQDFTRIFPGGKFYRAALPEVGFRFKSASAAVDGRFYIHGGYSSLNGNQAFAIKYYNDLLAIDLEDGSVSTLWAGPRSDDGAPMGRNLIWNGFEECFYAVQEEKGAPLLRLSPDSPGTQILSRPCEAVKGVFHQFDLYHKEGDGRLYLSVISAGADASRALDIYSMDWPPVDCLSVSLKLPVRRSPLPLCAAVLLLLGGSLFLLLRRKKTSAPSQSGAAIASPVVLPGYDFSKASVCFFGGFRVMDKDGRDITSMFSPTLKSILVLIVLSTPRGGIASSRLDRIIWSYIPEDAAANSRNVQISRLRSVLSQIGGFEIKCSGKIWTAHCAEGVLCDYLELFRHLAALSSREDISAVSGILSRGALLPNMEQPWVEVIRKETVSKCTEFACTGLKRSDLSVSEQLLLADIVLKYDYMNEDAVLVKCRILCASGQIGVAKSVFDSFSSEYASVTGLDYPRTFKQVIK